MSDRNTATITTENENQTAEQIRQTAEAAETQRHRAIYKTCGGRFPAIEADAIEQAWTPAKVELEVMKASRPSVPAAGGGGYDSTSNPADVLEARLGQLAGQQGVVSASFSDRIIEQARKSGLNSLSDIIKRAGMLDGLPPAADLQQSFTTTAVSTILGNVINKVAEAHYRAIPGTATKVAKKLTANDFKTHTGVRIDSDSGFELVGDGGELNHGDLSEGSYDFAVDTYGKIFTITRQMIKNDDLSVFSEIPRLIARAAKQKMEKLFWTLVLANTGSFFHADSSNYLEGATSTLGVASLGMAIKMQREMVDSNGEPLCVIPKYLVVPPSLESTAHSLNNSIEIRDPGASDMYAIGSPFACKLEVLVVPHLSNTGMAGCSNTAWYLLSDPADVAAFGLAFLDGVETPTIEEADVQANLLGQSWRGYHDFGCCQVDSHGAIMSKGA